MLKAKEGIEVGPFDGFGDGSILGEVVGELDDFFDGTNDGSSVSVKLGN